MLGGAAAAVLILVAGLCTSSAGTEAGFGSDIPGRGRSPTKGRASRPPSRRRPSTSTPSRGQRHVDLAAGGDALHDAVPALSAPGDYQLAFENDGLRSRSTNASVPAGQPVDVRRTMPGFDVDRAVAAIAADAPAVLFVRGRCDVTSMGTRPVYLSASSGRGAWTG